MCQMGFKNPMMFKESMEPTNGMLHPSNIPLYSTLYIMIMTSKESGSAFRAYSMAFFVMPKLTEIYWKQYFKLFCVAQYHMDSEISRSRFLKIDWSRNLWACSSKRLKKLYHQTDLPGGLNSAIFRFRVFKFSCRY